MSGATKKSEITLKNDFMFKLFLGSEKNKPILQDFLECAFGFLPCALEGFELLDKELTKDKVEDKMGVLDIHIRLKDGTHIDLEMQQLWTQDFVARSVFYLAKIYIEDFTQGSSYAQLKKCVSVNIIAKGFDLNERIHSVYVLKEKDIDDRLGDLIEFHFFNLEKVKGLPIVCKNTKENRLINWLKFINSNSKEERAMLASTSPVLEVLNEQMNTLTLSKEERRLYESRMKLKSDIVTISESSFNRGLEKGIEKGIAKGIEKGIEKGRKEGREEGIEKGREEGIAKGIEKGSYEKAIDTAKKCLAMNMPIETIIEITGLTREEILKI